MLAWLGDMDDMCRPDEHSRPHKHTHTLAPRHMRTLDNVKMCDYVVRISISCSVIRGRWRRETASPTLFSAKSFGIREKFLLLTPASLFCFFFYRKAWIALITSVARINIFCLPFSSPAFYFIFFGRTANWWFEGVRSTLTMCQQQSTLIYFKCRPIDMPKHKCIINFGVFTFRWKI